MNNNHSYFLGLYYRLTDFFSVNLAFLLGVFIRFSNEPTFSFIESGYASFLIFVNLVWIVSSSSQRIYSLQRFSGRFSYVLTTAAVVLLHLLIIVAFNGLIKTYYSRLFIFFTYVNFIALMLLFRFLANWVYRLYLNRKVIKSAIVIVGDEIYQGDVEGFLMENINEDFQEIFRLAGECSIIEKLESIKQNLPISELYVPLSKYNEDELEELSNYCDNNFIRMKLIFDSKRISARKMTAFKYNQTTVFGINLTPLDDGYNILLKRIFDFLFASFCMLFLFSWLFPIIAIAIKLSSKGPVFFTQMRTGIDNKEFKCYKFRSMKMNVDADRIQATANDPRITKIGAFLRRTSLDELPQFINVIRGEMSIVGPRPHMLKHTEEYSQIIGNFMNRHAIKPGITGLAQIKGYRGEIDDISLLQNRVRLDRFYVNNWTLLLDIKIVIQTALTIFKDHK